MKPSKNKTAKSSKHRLLLLAITSGLLQSLPGCGIPQLRCAQPGAMMPSQYNIVPGPSIGTAGTVVRDASSNDAAKSGDSAAPAADKDKTDTDNKSPDSEKEKTESESESSASDKSAASSKGFLGRFKLAGFVKPASSLNMDDTKKEQDAAKPANDATKSSNDASSNMSAGYGTTSSTFGGAGNVTSSANTYDANSNVGMNQIDANLDVNNIENSALLGWHQFFEDPILAGLIDQAMAGNQELKILGEDIQIACNEVYARSGEYRPFLSFGADAGVDKSGRYTRNGAVEENLPVAPGKSFPDPLPNFLVGGNVSWQIDIWKRLRNAQRSAALRYLATAEGRNFVVTRLVADVAENYYELLALDNRLVTLDRTIAIQESSLQTAEAMKEAARGTELAVQRFQAEVRKNQSQKLIIQQDIVEAENRINFLLGRYPQQVERPSVEYIDLNLRSISAGVPAQLLRNRPDIREAERTLQAAGLDIQVARARFYPALNLNAGLGYNAFSTGYLFKTPESLIYSASGDLIAPLINKRAIQAAYRTANAQQLQAVYDYQRTVLNAYTEVINQMTKVDNYGKSIEVKKEQLAALVGSVDSATKLFQNARGEYLDVLLAQRDMMEARLVIIETKQQQLSAVVRTYQALGGSGARVTYN